MEDLWFEEELTLDEGAVSLTIKELTRDSETQTVDADEIRMVAKGVVQADRPRWQALTAEQKPLQSGTNSRFYLVRLGYQFYVPREAHEKGTRFIFGRCEAHLRAANPNQPHPSVYQVIPDMVVEGEPRKVTIKLGPEITVGDYGGSLGEISTDVLIGLITPAVTGWPGKEEREPFWELRPINKDLTGTQHLWLVVDVPQNCQAFRLSSRVEGDVQTKFGPFGIGPKEKLWDNRPSVVIE